MMERMLLKKVINFIGSNSVDYIIIEEPLIIFLNNFYKEFNRDYLIILN